MYVLVNGLMNCQCDYKAHNVMVHWCDSCAGPGRLVDEQEEPCCSSRPACVQPCVLVCSYYNHPYKSFRVVVSTYSIVKGNWHNAVAVILPWIFPYGLPNVMMHGWILV